MPKTGSGGKRNVRIVKRGDIIKLRSGEEEVVRNVQVILQMANGSNEVYEPTETVEVIPPEDVPELT